jgi:hypothetical protein
MNGPGIPEMHVHIDDAGQHKHPFSIDAVRRGGLNGTDCDDRSIFHADIRLYLSIRSGKDAIGD